MRSSGKENIESHFYKTFFTKMWRGNVKLTAHHNLIERNYSGAVENGGEILKDHGRRKNGSRYVGGGTQARR